jgi:glycosyltransferase involved in cell wall biosynthesis
VKTLVVARYQEDTSWYSRIPSDWQLLEVQKGRELENTGREASSFLWAILHLYPTLQPDDVVAFVQADPFDHSPDIDLFLLLDRPTTGFRALGDYTYLSNGDGSPHHEGIPVKERYEEWLGKKWPGVVRFAPGAQFAAPGSAILRHPPEFWQKLLDVMADEWNPWILERLWPTILETPVAHRATFYCQSTPVTTYLRCELPARYLPGKVMRGAAMIDNDDSVDFPEQSGAAVFQFAGNAMEALQVMFLKDKGFRVLMESDDNYFTVAPSMKNTGWVKEKKAGPFSLDGHATILKHVDGCIVTTEFLAKQYRKHNSNVYVCPNAIDPLDWPVLKKPDDGVLRIGWFLSASHKADSPLVYRALEWASRQKDVEVWIAGSDPFVDGHGRVQFPHGHFPWSDLPKYRERMAYLDIGVAPVKSTPWALCRSDLKAIEKAYAGAARVLSDNAPYSLFTDGENCLKAKDARGFYERIRHLVQNRDEVKQLAAAGRKYVTEERLITQQIHNWEVAVAD